MKSLLEDQPGHFLTSQPFTSSAGPNLLQSLPPKAGAGLVHDLYLEIVPGPHGWVHSVHDDHSV